MNATLLRTRAVPTSTKPAEKPFSSIIPLRMGSQTFYTLGEWRKMLIRSAIALVLLVFCVSAHGRIQERSDTNVLDGVYSDGQALRGQNLYAVNCGTCHGDRLEGVSAPELTGDRFIERWREAALHTIYGFIRERMPLGRSASDRTISDTGYLDILAYILKFNSYPASPNELSIDALESIDYSGGCRG